MAIGQSRRQRGTIEEELSVIKKSKPEFLKNESHLTRRIKIAHLKIQINNFYTAGRVVFKCVTGVLHLKVSVTLQTEGGVPSLRSVATEWQKKHNNNINLDKWKRILISNKWHLKMKRLAQASEIINLIQNNQKKAEF